MSDTTPRPDETVPAETAVPVGETPPPAEPTSAVAEPATAVEPAAPVAEPVPLVEPAPAVEPAPLVEPAASEKAPVSEAAAATPVVAAAPEPAVAAERAAAPEPAPVAAAPIPTPAPDNRYVYVEAPTPPRRKGNRGFGVLFAIVATIVFAALYAVAAIVILTLTAPTGFFAQSFTGFLSSTVFWVPGLFFLLFFILLALLLNRAGWWAWVLGSLFVGVLTYAGSIVVFLLESNVVQATPQQANHLLASLAINPFVIASALLAREVALWLGAAIAARGRRVKARNVAAREEFDREAEAKRAEYDAARAA